jgi:D-hexose-6-phosphate mutarotase
MENSDLEWNNRLSPKEYCGLEEIKEEVIEELEREERDLEKLREYERNNPKPIVLTNQDKMIIEEQKETGQIMDQQFKRELFLRENKEDFPISDYTKILYRLPLNEQQIEKLYNQIMNEKK